jgi:glycosyltransferase involved in cell wall biosynthesis
MQLKEPSKVATSASVDSSKVSIVIPAHNEESVIGQVLDQLHNLADFLEIIVVDDGSTDNTIAIAIEHGARIVRHPYNIGNGAAVKSGIRETTGDVIVLMDADGQHPPKDVLRLVSYIGDYDMVVGARTRESDSAMHRNLANLVFNRYASYIIGYQIPDLTSGFRAIKAPILKRFVYLLPNGFSYPSTITIAMFQSGFRVKYEPIVAPARIGRSKIRPLKDGLAFLLKITQLGIIFVPMKIFLPISALFEVAGLIYGAYLLTFFHLFSNMAALLILLGVIIFLMGLVAYQVAMLRMSGLSN